MIDFKDAREDSVRKIILYSNHLLERSTSSIEDITSDICGLQYDPNPTIHLNHYMMLWNRKVDFKVSDLDQAAYGDFKVIETIAFKRNLFFVPLNEYSVYRAATKGIVRWGTSEELKERYADNDTDRAAEMELFNRLRDLDGMTSKQIWEKLGLIDEWKEYLKGRAENNFRCELPIFHAFFRMVRRSDIITCGRKEGTFREPVYILRQNIGINEWPHNNIDDVNAKLYVIEKFIKAFGLTNPTHISHLTGIILSEVSQLFEELKAKEIIIEFPEKVRNKTYYMHSSNLELLKSNLFQNSDGQVKLISPMDGFVRDKKWLETFFDYSFSFEYFKKKGMKWPLSILVDNRFIGYLDCKMDWKKRIFIVKEKNIFDDKYVSDYRIKKAIEELAAFHDANQIIEGK